MIVYYKMRQMLLQNAIQNAAHVYYKIRQVLITKCDSYYKMRRLLKIATLQGASRVNG